jgi:nucleotide-binding universal stress UspA family protein
MKKILFPTDFSTAANHAFVYALKVAEAIDASIVTLHVYNKPDISQIQLPPSLKEVYDSIDLDEFDNYRDTLPLLRQIAADNNLSQVPLINLMEEGETLATIIKVANREAADFIIMGTKGAGWLKEIFFGTVAAEVMEHAPCPVLAIPKEAVFDGVIDQIVMTTEYLEVEVEAVNKLLKFADVFKAAVTCVHIDLSHLESYVGKMDAWKKHFPNLPNLSFEVVDGTDVFKGLTQYLKENKTDMIVMLTQKRSFWEELFHYSRAKQMTYHQQTPVLAIPVHTL